MLRMKSLNPSASPIFNGVSPYMVIDLINKGQVYRCLTSTTNLDIMRISLDRAFEHHERLVQQPILATRHHVEEVPEAETFNFSERLKGFFAKFRGWRMMM